MTLTPRQEEAVAMLGGDQRHSEIVGGARSGKTFTLVRAMCIRAIRAPDSRHVIIRFRKNAVVESIWLDTLPKVLKLCWPELRPKWREQLGYLEFPNKAELWIGGLDDKERVDKILGKEFVTMYFNECSQIPYASVQVALTRLAQKVDGLKQRAYYDLNPVAKSHWTHRLFIEGKSPDSMESIVDPENYRHLFMNPEDNRENLEDEYIKSLQGMSAKQRKRFYSGEYDSELEGALWRWEMIENYRIAPQDFRIDVFVRIVVAIDPAVSKSNTSDETGIIVIGLTNNGHLVVIADLSGKYLPIEWARVAIGAYRRYRADRIVGERNNGGDLVESNIRAVDPSVAFRPVWASRGKTKRAEPVASIYERGLVHHVGRLPVLEDQMLSWVPGKEDEQASPDHMDAMVWGATDLVIDPEEMPMELAPAGQYQISSI